MNITKMLKATAFAGFVAMSASAIAAPTVDIYPKPLEDLDAEAADALYASFVG